MGYQDTLTGENAGKRNQDGHFNAALAAVAQAATGFVILGVAPFAGRIVSAEYIPNATIVGADTDTRIHRVYNRKDDNTGSVIMASLQFDEGEDAPAKIAKALTLSATAAHLLVEAGDVLEYNSAAVGDGIADGGGKVIVKLARS